MPYILVGGYPTRDTANDVGDHPRDVADSTSNIGDTTGGCRDRACFASTLELTIEFADLVLEFGGGSDLNAFIGVVCGHCRCEDRKADGKEKDFGGREFHRYWFVKDVGVRAAY